MCSVAVFILESETDYNYNNKTIRNFLDLIVLTYVRGNPPTTGYEIVRYLYKKFDLLLSPGTVYSTLYSLERQNLVEGDTTQGKRVYRLTEKGEREIQITKDSIKAVISSIFPS